MRITLPLTKHFSKLLLKPALAAATVAMALTVNAQAPKPAAKPGMAKPGTAKPAAGASAAPAAAAKPIVLDISQGWKFLPGDCVEYSKPVTLLRKNFKPINVAAYWDDQGYNLTGYAWYVNEVVVPLAMQKQATRFSGLRIDLGEIDEDDQTFFNGEEVGDTGDMNMRGKAEPNHRDDKRQYMVPIRKIKFGGKNLIAVRVYNHKGKGGMKAGPYALQPISWTDLVSIEITVDPKNTYAPGSPVIYSFNYKNDGDKDISGSIAEQIIDETGAVVQETKKEQTVRPGLGSGDQLAFVPKKPGFYRARTVFTETESGNKISSTKVMGYVNAPSEPYMAVKPAAGDKVTPAIKLQQLESVKLQGYFGRKFETNLQKRILAADEEMLLASHEKRSDAADGMGGLAGKYLQGAILGYRYFRNPTLKSSIDRIAYRIILSADSADGYLGSSDAENKWAGADAAEIRQNMAGLLAYHELTGYKPALDICKRSGDLLIATYGDGKRDIITAGTPGESGLASTAVLSPMTDLYRLTGEAKYLEFCKYITHAYEAANGPHLLTRPNAVGKSADLLANLNGLAKLYVLTGDAQYLKAATADHKDLTENFLSITGSADPADEACTVSEWAELNTRLFSLTGELHYMDLFERAAYNGLAASASPSTGCAHIKSSEAGSKTYSCLPSAQLAASAGAILQVPGMVTGLKDGGAAILAYTNFSDRITLVEGPKPVTLTLTMTSRFPDDGMKTMLIMQPSKPMEFSVWLRVPNWCSSFKVSMIGGKNAREGKPGEWLEFKEEWKRGDKLYIDFDIPVSLTDAGPKNAGMAAVVRGPQVLAADSVLNKAFRLDDASVLSAPFMPADESEKKEKDKKPKPGGYRPQVPSGPVRLLRAAFPAGWEGGQAYSVSGNAAGKNTDIVLVPYAEAGQSGSQSQLWFKKQ